MSTTPWIKLTAFGMMAWVVFGVQLSAQIGAAMGVTAGFLVLLMLLDAAQVEEDRRERGADRGAKPARSLMHEVSSLGRRCLSWQVSPFYLVLGLVGWLGSERLGDMENGRMGESKGLPESRGWGTEVGSAHEPGKSGLCACGKPSGHDKTAAPPIKSEEVAKRAEAIQKRTMKPVPRSLPAGNLPGIGPNAKPLPPGLVPNANAKLPPGIAPAAPANPPPPPSPTPGSVNGRQLPVGGGESPGNGETGSGKRGQAAA